MGGREKILQRLSRAVSTDRFVPELDKKLQANVAHGHDAFVAAVEKIGGKTVAIENWASLTEYILQNYTEGQRIVSGIAELPWFSGDLSENPRSFEDVDLAILKGHFGVAENGAVWITNSQMGNRALPFITQHLALVINKTDIVPTLLEAYEQLSREDYDFGTFIAGPSKTADIEQSLVLGAHGPKSLTLFILD